MGGFYGGNRRVDGGRRKMMWGSHTSERKKEGRGAVRCWACLAVWLGRALGLVSAPFHFFSSFFYSFLFLFSFYLLQFGSNQIQTTL
jgi:hypothetical protein